MCRLEPDILTTFKKHHLPLELEEPYYQSGVSFRSHVVPGKQILSSERSLSKTGYHISFLLASFRDRHAGVRTQWVWTVLNRCSKIWSSGLCASTRGILDLGEVRYREVFQAMVARLAQNSASVRNWKINSQTNKKHPPLICQPNQPCVSIGIPSQVCYDPV